MKLTFEYDSVSIIDLQLLLHCLMDSAVHLVKTYPLKVFTVILCNATPRHFWRIHQAIV